MNLLALSTLPNTGEAVKNYGAYIGMGVAQKSWFHRNKILSSHPRTVY